jgi:hypothetical protein
MLNIPLSLEAKIQLLEKPQDMTDLSTNYVTFTKFH